MTRVRLSVRVIVMVRIRLTVLLKIVLVLLRDVHTVDSGVRVVRVRVRIKFMARVQKNN